MTNDAAARHLITAATHWAAIAESHQRAGDHDEATLDGLGAMLAAASAWSRAHADLTLALDAAPLPSGPERDEAETFLERVRDALSHLQGAFAGRCDRVVAALTAAGDHDALVEARELAARHLEGLAQGRSLADLYHELTSHSCSCAAD